MWAYLLTDGLTDDHGQLTDYCYRLQRTTVTATDCSFWETINYHSRPHQLRQKIPKFFRASSASGKFFGKESEGKIVIRKIDKWWFRLLDRLNLWILDQLAGHCRREKIRRFRRILKAQIPWRN